MKVVTVIGARPQFIKAGPMSACLRATHVEKLIHTGQHYDYQMSEVFFNQLGIPMPDYNLGVGSMGHGAQTGAMLARIEEILMTEKPDWVLVYGDTNSTLAGALAAAKLHIPVAHVEAGLRSFNRKMPEEVNRVLTDHLAQILFCPTDQAVGNLMNEGINTGVIRTGDIMMDALTFYSKKADENRFWSATGLLPKQYALATIHRAENTDQPERLKEIVGALGAIAGEIVLPLHPRTRKLLHSYAIALPSNIKVMEPVGYLEMLLLEKGAQLILTDSGGVQKESYLWKVPCITLRDQTEWVETVSTGWNTLVGADRPKILEAVQYYRSGNLPPYIEGLYGDGQASNHMVRVLEERSAQA